MGADSHHMPLVQYDNFICIANAVCPLRYDNHRHILCFFCNCHTQFCICGVVQRTGAVVQNQNFRLSHQCAGNGQTLSLSAGKIGTALADLSLQPLWQPADKFLRLCNAQRLFHLLFGGMFISPF